MRFIKDQLDNNVIIPMIGIPFLFVGVFICIGTLIIPKEWNDTPESLARNYCTDRYGWEYFAFSGDGFKTFICIDSKGHRYEIK